MGDGRYLNESDNTDIVCVLVACDTSCCSMLPDGVKLLTPLKTEWDLYNGFYNYLEKMVLRNAVGRVFWP